MEIWSLHAVKVGVLAMLSVTYLGVTVCFVGIIFWESFLDSFRLWVSELSGWERLGGVDKVSVFWQKGEISPATLMSSAKLEISMCGAQVCSPIPKVCGS